MIALLVVLGAAVGAPLRYATDRWVQAHHGSGFPWGTFTVNVSGSLLLGLLAGSTDAPEVVALVGTGFCGAFTTYSTFAHETVELGRRDRLLAAFNAVTSVLAGLGAVGLGWALGTSAGL